ncbi:hypothetical protein [Streptomyces yaizuensis]|uniref:Secreted protein n=1 Tax=Streptomyces yaizuensis TaxID=2989713 RepID=A0ABQ5P6S0_9ACTN|nr:hypothetical protein [Streptomyces sp. YSPA8]GLF98290.1 hypothetical protein SYYSPA8_28355 [Streptomyces sp. YSPA8]
MPLLPATALRALAVRGTPLALVVLLALVGLAQGAGTAVGESGRPAPVSVPFDAPGQPEESDATGAASGRARACVGAPGPDAGPWALPARQGPPAARRGRAPLPPPPPAVRRAVLRC